MIDIQNATCYRHHPSSVHATASGDQSSNPPLFPDLKFSLPSFSEPSQHWSILSTSSSARTAFLQILRGQHIALPPRSRSFPYLATDEVAAKDLRLRSPQHAIQYVGFDAERGGLGGSSTQGSYLSARYESRKEETDFSLWDYLKGNTELNASEDDTLIRHPEDTLVNQVIDHLKLKKLIGMPVSNLSNGQTRRARIARALLSRPECLLLDGPFMGLDPPTVKHLSSLLYELAEARSPRLVLSLKPDEVIPDWITHIAFLLDDYTVHSLGPRDEVLGRIAKGYLSSVRVSRTRLQRIALGHAPEEPYADSLREAGKQLKARGYLAQGTFPEFQKLALQRMEDRQVTRSVDAIPAVFSSRPALGEPVVEMDGVQVRYGDRCVLGDWSDQPDQEGTQAKATKPGLHWTVRQGQRWGIFGANGSGKTTLLAMLTSDHPQSYSQPLKLFGRGRLPKPGAPALTLWDIQAQLGHSSPEVHAFFPKYLSIRRAVESAWADTPITPPRFTSEMDSKVDAALRWFQAEIMPSLGPTNLQREELSRWDPDRDPWKQPKKSTREPEALQDLKSAYEEYDVNPDLGLAWGDNTKFGEVSFSAQRVLLFLRAVIRNPPLLILDEAFSGMDDATRDKCLLFLSHGERLTRRLYDPSVKQPSYGKLAMIGAGGPVPEESDLSKLGRVNCEGLRDDQALLVVSHNPSEVPGCVSEWICLPESGQGPPRFGKLDGPLSIGEGRWEQIWGV